MPCQCSCSTKKSIRLKVNSWIRDAALLTRAKNIVFYEGSENQHTKLLEKACDNGTLIPLNEETYPNCYLHRSDPGDVARTEGRTFICSEREEDAGPTNNWMPPTEARQLVAPILHGSMRGKTMYVILFSMGPVDSPYSRLGIQLTDSLYTVLNMHLLQKDRILPMSHLDNTDEMPMLGVHAMCDLDPEHRYIVHFPEENLVWSVNSGYGGNALLGKKCMALRLASCRGKEEGWLVEHMMILELERPNGDTIGIAGAFPSGCGKTTVSMLESALPGYRVRTVSDDLCWMFVKDGQLRAIGPEAGFFPIAKGVGPTSNPNMAQAVRRGVIFTNTALTPDNEPWWEGIETDPPEGLVDWQGEPWDGKSPAAHPNSRFTVPADQLPNISPNWNDPEGIPISAIIFGGRRPTLEPVISEAFSFQHGIYRGLTMASETTAAATGSVGKLRRDPFAMKPFCGYNMADSVQHRLDIGKDLIKKPKIFYVNFFRQDTAGKPLLPDPRMDILLLRWIVDRVRSKVPARRTPVGFVPLKQELSSEYFDIDSAAFESMRSVDTGEWLQELELHKEYLEQFGNHLPQEIWDEYRAFKKRLQQT